MMRRLLPHPVLSTGLFASSILLSASVAPPSLILALLIALAAPQVMLALGVEKVRVKAPMTIVRLSLIVAGDVVRSNWAVARIILGRRRRERVSGFIRIPLDMRDCYGLAVLSIIITSTPGTLWVEYEAATGTLLLHILDLIDEAEWVRLIKGRYERHLMEIFE